MQKMQEIILVDKPKGITSFDVIRMARKELRVRKIGHSGTLDPLATGLLILGVGKGTKRLPALIGLPKTYEAEVLLGLKTDSGDITGTVIERAPVPDLSAEKIEEALFGMVGVHVLPAPLYSALKKGGKPLYRYAREGTPVEVPHKRMEVLSAHLQAFEGAILRIRFFVSSGTYVRTLAELLAERLGTVGTIRNLRRISIGDYHVSKACAVERLRDTIHPMKILEGFKQFIVRGNVVDLAVGVMIGAAFGALVNSLVSDILTPLIGAIAKIPDFSGLSFTLNESQFMYGKFLNALISFLIIAATIYFFIVTPLNSLLRRMKKEEEEKPKAPAEDILLLREIRDSLKR